jgi:monothiol glutaredoxin
MDITQTLKSIENDIQNNEIMLYMKGSKEAPQCGFSAQVVHILTDLGVEFETRDILQDPVLREAIKQFSDWPTLPQLYIKGEFIGGCDIVSELYQNGELRNIIDG